MKVNESYRWKENWILFLGCVVMLSLLFIATDEYDILNKTKELFNEALDYTRKILEKLQK